jgi:hypothetical protein
MSEAEKEVIVKLKCENCKSYNHKPNILGGVAECLKEVKFLTTFWNNEPCDEHELTEEDKLAHQKECYINHLGDYLDITKQDK